MTAEYAVTLERETLPPITHRGQVSGAKATTVVVRATREAMKAHPGLKWSSLAVVLLGRVQEAASDAKPTSRAIPKSRRREDSLRQPVPEAV